MEKDSHKSICNITKGEDEVEMILGKGSFLCSTKWQESQGTLLFLQEMNGIFLDTFCKPMLEIWPSLKFQTLQGVFTIEE